jgi:hypothetical protein
MISDRDLPELETYRRLEERLPMQSNPSLGSLVVSSGNENLPVHRWFRYKEAYSADLLGNVLSLMKVEANRPSCWQIPTVALGPAC